MPKCPHCNAEIEELVLFERIERKSRCALDEEQNMLKHYVAMIPTDEDDYECPECQNVIAQLDEDAEAFLMGKPI